MIKIKNHYTGDVIHTVDADTLRDASLCGASLRFANLRHADLHGADLYAADLYAADLGHADLFYADLRHANLRHANLSGAWFNWASHDLIAEILRQAAGDDPQRRAYAGLVLVSRDWCWERWAGDLRREYPDLSEWALGVLAPYVQDGDDAPDVLREAARDRGD